METDRLLKDGNIELEMMSRERKKNETALSGHQNLI